MDYTVPPGLYALGTPDPMSPILVTANYKLSFDHLRSAAVGLDVWILVLDTAGVNVWCAAGKGTFGTDELVRRVASADLGRVVVHRRLIVPQLGAPGIAAHEVVARSGFEVVWGPVLAEDVPDFLANGMEATPSMRRRRFGFRDRLAVIPVELVAALKIAIPVIAFLLLFGGLAGKGGFVAGALEQGITGVLVVLAAVVAGAVVVPALLPWIPPRPFALKGALVGLPLVAAVLWSRWPEPAGDNWIFEASGWLMVGTAVAAFVAMNFTGASTFTSPSGVKREMRLALPIEVVALAAGVGLVILSKWLGL